MKKKVELKAIKDYLELRAKSEEILSASPENYTLDKLCKQLGGHNLTCEYFDLNYKSINASFYLIDGEISQGETIEVYNKDGIEIGILKIQPNRYIFKKPQQELKSSLNQQVKNEMFKYLFNHKRQVYLDKQNYMFRKDHKNMRLMETIMTHISCIADDFDLPAIEILNENGNLKSPITTMSVFKCRCCSEYVISQMESEVKDVCVDCLPENAYVCAECETLCIDEDVAWCEDEDVYFCNKCISEHFFYCSKCKNLVRDNNCADDATLADPICKYCVEESKKEIENEN